MSLPYIDSDTLDECDRAIKLGCKIEYLAGKLRCSPEHLARLLTLPSKPAQQQSGELDLWAADDAKELL